MSSYRAAPHLAVPTPAHALTESAEAARRSVRDFAAARQAQRDAPPDLVTHHVPPWRQIPLEALTGAPATFAKAALKVGCVVAARAAGRAVTVAVRRPSIRVTWIDGKLSGTPVGLGAGAVVEGKTVPGAVATDRLTMSLADAIERNEQRKREAAATRAANKARKAALVAVESTP